MVTFDLLSGIMYAQMGLSLILFFFVQLLVLFARERDIGDWFAYRGTWIAVAIQTIFLLAVGILVWYTKTDPIIVGHTVLLILANMAWFITLRLSFEFADYIYSRRESSVD